MKCFKKGLQNASYFYFRIVPLCLGGLNQKKMLKQVQHTSTCGFAFTLFLQKKKETFMMMHLFQPERSIATGDALRYRSR